MKSVGDGEPTFDAASWQSAVFRVCRPQEEWEDPNDWQCMLWDESTAFQDSVALHTARGCLRLLYRLWRHPGDRVDGMLPERILWSWLRRRVIVIVGNHEIDPDDTDSWSHDDARKDAAMRLRSLIAPGPFPLTDLESVGSHRVDSDRLESDLHEAIDIVDDLVAKSAAFSEAAEPWPKLAALDRLVDELIAARAPVPAPAPMAITRPIRRTAGRRRKGPSSPEATHALCVALFNDYAAMEGERPPTYKDYADHLGMSPTTFGDRVVEFQELGLTWPLSASVAA